VNKSGAGAELEEGNITGKTVLYTLRRSNRRKLCRTVVIVGVEGPTERPSFSDRPS